MIALREFFRKTGIIAAAALVAVTLVFAEALPAIAADDGERDTIKVGFVALEGYNYIDSNEEWRGYDIELLLKLSQYSDMDFEPIAFDNAADAIKALEHKRVAALIDFNRTEKPGKEIHFLDLRCCFGGARHLRERGR